MADGCWTTFAGGPGCGGRPGCGGCPGEAWCTALIGGAGWGAAAGGLAESALGPGCRACPAYPDGCPGDQTGGGAWGCWPEIGPAGRCDATGSVVNTSPLPLGTSPPCRSERGSARISPDSVSDNAIRSIGSVIRRSSQVRSCAPDNSIRPKGVSTTARTAPCNRIRYPSASRIAAPQIGAVARFAMSSSAASQASASAAAGSVPSIRASRSNHAAVNGSSGLVSGANTPIVGPKRTTTPGPGTIPTRGCAATTATSRRCARQRRGESDRHPRE